MTITRRLFNQMLFLAGASTALPFHAFAEESKPTTGGTLNFVYYPEPNQIVAINTSAGGPATIGPKIFDGLLAYDYNLNPKPALAKEWSVSPDGLELTFKLREGVKFSDGHDLTSEDVAFSISRLREAHPRGRITFQNVTNIDTSDPHIVKITLSKPSAPILSALAATESPIVPKHIFEALKPTDDPAYEQIIGSGPFVLKEWVKGSHILVERNPTYWDAPRPHLDRIIFRFITDPGARAAALEAGEVDIGPNPVSFGDLERFKALPQFVVDTTVFAYSGPLHQLIINLENNYLKDQKVRQAIAHAINLEQLNNIVFYGYGQVSPTPISVVNTKYFDPDVKAATFDPALSDKILDEAGYKRGADGFRFKLRLTNNPYNPSGYSDFLKQALAKIGIDAEIQKFDFGTYVKTIYTDGAWDLSTESCGNIFDPSAGAQRLYWSKNIKKGLPFSNGTHYANPEVDAILEAAAIELDETKRKALFFKFQEIIAQELPIINLIAPPTIIVSKKTVKNYAPGGEGLSGSFADAYIDPNAA
ncbi:ABC transporter substrate-binding protein [Kaistia dalseonensis]|uniref:Peptide/nickel transport system substrate-binding protein n=1 Tax=Kaistia dalseonensis TaxID=410840 RepID=A0ABU0H1S4_9HYPH|nr:ABC transporter substrate-binding protein [Kaistia dalseonensis]MCX5493706.1 ABC transporter substrate-binding protein [Kaistia dalseonensis]MDQ0436269.1 peptide/nickel transport system substrate-binding protein [Kaistia dalseonensis]